jgi:hypothetical protein
MVAVREALELYRTCTSYADTGTVVTTLRYDDREPSVSEVGFRTAFIRDVGLRFEFWAGGHTAQGATTLLTNERGTFRLEPSEAPVPFAGLGEGVATFAGTSAGASTVVPGMLFTFLDVPPINLLDESCTVGRNTDREPDLKVTCWSPRSTYTLRFGSKSRLLESVEIREEYLGMDRFVGDPSSYAQKPLPLPGWVSKVRVITLQPRMNVKLDPAQFRSSVEE